MQNDDENSELYQYKRNQTAESTRNKIAAVRALNEKDFTRMTGSGINIILTDLSGNFITPEFCVNAEDMEIIKLEIIKSIVKSFDLRKSLLQREISDVENVLEKYGGNKKAKVN